MFRSFISLMFPVMLSIIATGCKGRNGNATVDAGTSDSISLLQDGVETPEDALSEGFSGHELFADSILTIADIPMPSDAQPVLLLADVDPISWRPSQPAVLELMNDDTVGLRTIDFLLVFNDNLSVAGLPVSIRITAPDSTYFTEEFVVAVSGEKRRNMDFHESLSLYRDLVVLDQSGLYVFTISPKRQVAGLKAIGLNIE